MKRGITPAKTKGTGKMQLDQVRTAIETTPAGANVILEWTRPVDVKKPFKALQGKILKDVRMVGRIGINYDKLHDVQDKRESGELPSENAGLMGSQEWAEFPWLIFNPKAGHYCIRLYPSSMPSQFRTAKQFRIGESVVAFDDIKEMLYAKEWPNDRPLDCFQVKIADINRIHRETVDGEMLTSIEVETEDLPIIEETPELVPLKSIGAIAKQLALLNQ